MNKIKRSEFATFLNTTPSSTATWSRMGKGITEQTIAYNSNTTSETYIDEDNATTNVNSYAISIDTPQTAYKGEPVFDFIDGLRQSHAVGSDCETELLMVNIYDVKSGSTYSAEKNKCVIQLNEFGGQGGESVAVSYTIHVNGDPEIGTCTITGGVPTFTKG